MRCSSSTPVSGSLMRMQRLPRTLAPKSTMPSILEISAASFGRRASNNSATRGRPPVMSFVFARFARRLGQQRAGDESCRLRRRRCARRRNRIIREHFVSCRPVMMICGCKSSLCSMMTMASWPVVSSTSCFIVTPSMMSWNFTLPAFSERIGTLYGSHCTKVSPFLTLPPFGHGNDRADDDVVAFQFAAILVEHAESSHSCSGRCCCRLRASAPGAVRCKRITPSYLALICGCLNTCAAVPPMWNVRIVSCVPGSPMDCAAMMPTASPSLTRRRSPDCVRSKSTQTPCLLSQVSTERIFTFSTPPLRSPSP